MSANDIYNPAFDRFISPATIVPEGHPEGHDVPQNSASSNLRLFSDIDSAEQTLDKLEKWLDSECRVYPIIGDKSTTESGQKYIVMATYVKVPFEFAQDFGDEAERISNGVVAYSLARGIINICKANKGKTLFWRIKPDIYTFHHKDDSLGEFPRFVYSSCAYARFCFE
jgi:hypothetical protein